MDMAEEAFQTASDVAYQIISQKILDGEFPPGMKLSRRKMAEAAGVSVIPVIGGVQAPVGFLCDRAYPGEDPAELPASGGH